MEKQGNPMTASLSEKLSFLEKGWLQHLQGEFVQPYMEALNHFVKKRRAEVQPVYPSKENVFRAFQETPFEKVKVVIMGQDPYHGPGQANGLCFSVSPGVPCPPSLVNIYKEIKSDLGIPPSSHGDLSSWAKQGVLLLNATLTVSEGQPKSHYGQGWERFTDAVVRELCKREDPLIFVLWGRSAREKVERVIREFGVQQHSVLVAPHPSPLSAHSGFFGCRHFSQINALLQKENKTPINWQLPPSS